MSTHEHLRAVIERERAAAEDETMRAIQAVMALRELAAAVRDNQERVSHGHNDGWAREHAALDAADAVLNAEDSRACQYKENAPQPRGD